jgi:site-specific DNA-methyltransferase (adenine-specific)
LSKNKGKGTEMAKTEAKSPRTVGTLTPAPYNPRKITDKQLGMLAKSMAEFGDLSGIVRNVKTGNLVGGHQRIKNLDPSWPIISAPHTDNTGTVALGYIETPSGRWQYREVDWPEKKEAAANIAANQHGGEFDLPALKEIILTLDDGSFDMDLIGFNSHEIELMMTAEFQGEPADAEPQIDRAEELNKVWKVKAGDLWQIGTHRLLCGDSTKAEDVARVMGGEKADACISDPPYGIGFDTDYTRFTAPKSQQFAGVNKKHAPVHGDDAPFDPATWLAFDSVVLWGANYYAGKLPIGTWLVWDKRFDNGKAWLSDAELAWMKGGTGVYIFSLTSQGMIRPEPVQHPTQKAVALMVWCIEKSKAGEIIIDPFLGSGTTMVACQNLNRKCRGIEISPDYCSVILQRMFDAFGIKGVRVD